MSVQPQLVKEGGVPIVQVGDLCAAKDAIQSIRAVPGNHEVDSVLETGSKVLIPLWIKVVRCPG